MPPSRETSPPGSGLHQCALCRADYVIPVSWEPVEERGWHLLLRCGECETYRAVVIGEDVARAFERDLEWGAAQIRTALEELDRARMTAQVAAFIIALRRDLIDAEDFAVRRWNRVGG